MQQGWIKLHRSLLDNFLWQEKRTFNKAEAWLDLLLRANFDQGTVMINGIKLNLEPGQFATTIVHLSERWGWSRTKVSSFLDTLAQEQMIAAKKTSKYTLLTILRWGFYQREEQGKSIKKATKEQEKSIKKAQTKNVKNIKNDKNNITPLTPQGEAEPEPEKGFNAFWAVYPRKTAKAAASKAWEKLAPDDDLVKIIVCAVEAQKASAQWHREDGRYIPSPATWLNGRRWEDELTTGEKQAKEEKTHDKIIKDAQGAWGNIGEWY